MNREIWYDYHQTVLFVKPKHFALMTVFMIHFNDGRGVCEI
jgi:hypothetical protein